MLIVHHSNRLERLAEILAEVLREPLDTPFDAEVIAVQSTGMARWLSMKLAERLGLSANIRFPFPARLVWDLFRTLLPDVPERSPYAREVMAWRLMGLLPEVLEGPGFEPLRAYLKDEDALRRYELAVRIADLFDQYLVYRPDWIARWEREEDDSWHAHLWRRLVSASGPDHRVRIQRDALAALDIPQIPAGLPRRINLFGIPTLPPVELEVFARMASRLDVHLFLLNPCLHYWTEIRSDREIARRVKDQDPRRLYLETGNSLLASLGKQGRDFLRLLQECDAAEDEAFEDPGGDSLLHCLQSDILNLRNPGEDAASLRRVPAGDCSIQVHSCHNPMREIEVLYDQLLALFQADPGLEPGDVAVMTPDIEAYAPLVEAVFGTAESSRSIPFSIADRRRRAENAVANALLTLLEVVEGRFEAAQVLALLEAEVVRRRFGIAEAELAQIRDWVREVGVRWAADAEDRGARGLPANPEHTWRAGLDRLLLGYALPGDGRRLYNGILPYDDVEGAAGQVLGKLCSFAEALCALREEISRPRPVDTWADTLASVLRRFLDESEEEGDEFAAVRRAISALAEDAAQTGFTDPIPLAVARAALQAGLEAGQGGPFLTGRVTFCAMVPMRSVPFKVVCLIGMNDGSYPRSRRAAGFDLMSRDVRPGDRSRRDDDRYLFLEAIVSARDVLYLSYVGQSVRDNSPLPPSVLVSDLLDYLERGFTSESDGGRLRDRLVVRHPLHAFSPRYFGRDETLFSFSEELCEASRQRRRPSGAEGPFVAAPLQEPAPEWRTVDLGQLIRFFQHPVRYLVRERLRVHLEEQEEVVESREPFVLDALSAYGLRRDLLDLALAGCPPAEALPIVRAGGRLPQGRVGEVLFAAEAERVAAFARELARHLPADRLQPIPADLDLGPVRLTGWLAGVSPQGLLDYRPTSPKPKDWIALWLRHLVLHALRPAGVTLASVWLGDGEAIQLGPVENAGTHLARLAGAYWDGLHRPLPLLPEASFAFAERLHRTGDAAQALKRARTVWRGNDYQPGECQDAYHRLVFREEEPLNADFERLARDLLLPMLEHRQ